MERVGLLDCRLHGLCFFRRDSFRIPIGKLAVGIALDVPPASSAKLALVVVRFRWRPHGHQHVRHRRNQESTVVVCVCVHGLLDVGIFNLVELNHSQEPLQPVWKNVVTKHFENSACIVEIVSADGSNVAVFWFSRHDANHFQKGLFGCRRVFVICKRVLDGFKIFGVENLQRRALVIHRNPNVCDVNATDHRAFARTKNANGAKLGLFL